MNSQTREGASERVPHFCERHALIESTSTSSDSSSVDQYYEHHFYTFVGRSYPRFTMLGQSLGSMVLAWECLRAFNPDVFIDTTGA